MKNKPRILTREEVLALECTLIITAVLCLYSFYLKQGELAETRIVSLYDYTESLNIPRSHPDASRRVIRKANRGLSPPITDSIVATDSISFVNKSVLAEFRLTSTSDSPSEMNSPQTDSSRVELSPVFRRSKPSWELDSILTMPGESGVALLRQHVIYESRAYDTALTNHLIRSANELAQVDVSSTLETQMKFNVGRYGLPYNPLRPQPPSPQVNVKPIVIALFDFLYTQAKGVSAAVTRVVKPREKKTPE